MHKRILPACLPIGTVIFAFIILSCNKPVNEEASPDTTEVADTVVEEQGNMDGDYFVSNADSTEEEIEEMIDVRSPVMDVCGFSDDGKYFAFTQYITGEGGDADAAIYVIDVEKNEWAAKPQTVEDYGSEMDQAVINLRDWNLPKYNITYQKNPGKFYTLDLLIDLHVKGNGKDITLQKDKSLPKSRGSVREYRLSKALTFNDKIAVFVEYDGELAEGFEGFRYFERKYIAVTGVVK